MVEETVGGTVGEPEGEPTEEPTEGPKGKVSGGRMFVSFNQKTDTRFIF